MSKTNKFYIRIILLQAVLLFSCTRAFCTEPPVINGSVRNVLCNGGATGAITTTISNGASPFVYSWSNGATTNGLTNVAANTYTVTVIDINAISATASFTVTQPSALDVSGGIIPTCGSLSTGTVDLFVSGGSPGPGGYSYKWSNGTTGQNATSLAAGTYLVTVTDSFACKVTQSFSITSTALPTASPTATPATICSGVSTTLAAHATAGGAPITTYTWSNGTTTGVSSLTVSPTSSTTYIVTVTNRYFCTASGSVLVTVNASPATPTITASGPTALCKRGKVTLTSSTAKGDSYLWNTGATTTSITVKEIGFYDVTISTKLGCSKTSASVQVTTNLNCEGAAATDDKSTNEGDYNAVAPASTDGDFNISVYPNPYTGEFHLKMLTGSLDNISVSIYNIAGQLIEERKNILYDTDVQLGSAYAAGVYILQVKQGDSTKVVRVVKSE